MKVAIIGAGNMGRRYSSILTFYRIDHDLFDVDTWKNAIGYDYYIIASSTEAHEANIEHFLPMNKPILCEKPIVKDIKLVEEYFEYPTFQMVDQYRHLVSDDWIGPTAYDYFKSGSDTIAWDCINIIGHANKKPTISNVSPVWRCQINGLHLNIGDMDRAYMKEINSFLMQPRSNKAHGLKAHKRVVNNWFQIK